MSAIALIVLTVVLITQPSRAEQPVARIEYSLDEPRSVSMAVYDGNGRLVRTLLRGERQDVGSQCAAWDGLDQWGCPMPPGSYRWRLLQTLGFTARYQLTIGVNPKPHGWERWTGNHSGVTGITVGPMVLGDEQTRRDAPPLVMYLSGAGSEVLPGTVVQTLDGERERKR